MKHLLLCIFFLTTFCAANAQSTIKVDTSLRSNKQIVQVQPQANTTGYELKQNYPNPFNRTTRIEFSLPDSRLVEFRVYDMLGHLVTSKMINCHEGTNYITLERENMYPGFYFYSIQTGNIILTKRLMVRD